VITLQGVGVSKAGREILSDISLTLRERRIGIIGHNGSGKSTFAKLLNGLESCSRGHVAIGDAGASDDRIRRMVGFVFQNPDNQIVFPIVEEDLAFGLKKSGLSKADIAARVADYMERFGISHLKRRFTHELSGGEKQLIALIGVLVMEPGYVVLDEPTTLLDLRNRAMLLKTLRALEQTLVIVSHDLDFMMDMERVVLIHEGRIHADGDPATVIATYRDLSTC